MRHLVRADEPAIDAAQADRIDPGIHQCTHDALVDRTAQHHFDQCQRLGVGDAQPVDIARFNA